MQPGTCRCPQPLKIWHLQSDSALAQCKGGGSLAAAGQSTQPAPSWQHTGDSSLCQLGGTSLPWVCGSSRVNRRVRMGLLRVLPGRTVARSVGKGLLVLPIDPVEVADGNGEQGSCGAQESSGPPVAREHSPSHTTATSQLCCLGAWDGAQLARCSRVPCCPGRQQLPAPVRPSSLFSPGRAEQRGAPRCSYTTLWEKQ